MAYVFNNIRSSMDEEDQGQGTNVFDPNAGQVNNNGETNQSGSTPEVKTSTAGEMGDVAGAGTNETSSEQKPADVQAKDATVFQKNAGKMKAPKAFEQIGTDLDDADARLQTEADTYLNTANETDYSVDDETIESAISGDEDASATVGNYFSGEMNPQADAFDVEENDYMVRNTSNLRSDDGVRSLLAQDAGEQYNAGESAFDMMLLNRTPEFRTIRDSLAKRQDDLNERIGTYESSDEEGLTDDAQLSMNTNYGTATDGIRNYLTENSEGVIAALEEKARVENEARGALEGNGFGEEQSAAAMADLIEQYELQDPRMIEMLEGSGLDINDFIDYSGDVDWQSMAGQEDATRFNAIMGLLGNEDTMAAGGGAGDRQSFRMDDYKKAVEKSASNRRARKDKELKAEIDAMIKSYTTQASSNNQRNSGNFESSSRHMANEDIGRRLEEEFGRKAYVRAVNGGANAADFNREQTWQDFVDEKSAGKMNNLYKSLGLDTKVNAGGGRNSWFDNAGYEKALRAAIATNQARDDAKKGGPVADQPGTKATGNTNWGNNFNPMHKDDDGESNASKWNKKLKKVDTSGWL